eukprot:4381505-Ditylum_brightwellii.AAC.1
MDNIITMGGNSRDEGDPKSIDKDIGKYNNEDKGDTSKNYQLKEGSNNDNKIINKDNPFVR